MKELAELKPFPIINWNVGSYGIKDVLDGTIRVTNQLQGYVVSLVECNNDLVEAFEEQRVLNKKLMARLDKLENIKGVQPQ